MILDLMLLKVNATNCVPLSSPLRFFFSDTVTSVLIIEVSLLRSFVLSTIVDDDITGADNGRDTLVVVKSKFWKCTYKYQNL